MASPNLLHHSELPAPETWLTRADFLARANRSDSWLKEKLRQGAIETKATEQRLGNGRTETLYAVSSLPKGGGEPERLQQPLILFPSKALTITASRMTQSDLPAQASGRMQALNPILDFRQYGTGAVTLKLPNGEPVTTLDRMVRYQSIYGMVDGKPVSTSTLWRWLRRYDATGAAELTRKPRADANHSRYFAEPAHQAAAVLVASLYLGDGYTPGLSMQACFDCLTAQQQLVGLTPDDLPTYKTVCRFLHSTPNHLKMLAREGKKRFNETMLPYLRRGYTEASNQIWVSDHMIADVEVQNDCFRELPFGAPLRLRLTCLLDYRSRFVVGYSWAVEGTSASIATALRQAVLAYGPAEQFYCDNGKDYVKVAKGATPGYLQPSGPENWWQEEMDFIDRQTGVLARLGMRVTHCIPHHPQSKHVERFFRTVHAQFCSKWWTYTSGTPSTRPDATTAMMELHRKSIRHGELHRSMHPPATVFMALFRTWLAEYHAAGDRAMEGMQGRSPAEVFAAERNPGQRPTPSPADLACLLAEHTARTVDSCAVTVNKIRYVPADLVSSHIMLERNRHKVTVAFDPIDPGQVAILDEHGRLLTMLEAETLVRFAPEDPETQRQIGASMQQRGELARTAREQIQSLTRARRQLGVRTPLEMLADKTLPAPAEDTITQRAPRVRDLAQDRNRASSAPMYAYQVATEVLQEEK